VGIYDFRVKKLQQTTESWSQFSNSKFSPPWASPSSPPFLIVITIIVSIIIIRVTGVRQHKLTSTNYKSLKVRSSRALEDYEVGGDVSR
jgi:hypothetical protein